MKLASLGKKLTLLALSSFGIVANSFAAQNTLPRKYLILWDLGFVLVKPNQFKMSTQYVIPKTCGLNPWNLVRLGVLWKKGCLASKGIQDTMDAVLHNARPDEPRQTMIVSQHGEPHANIDCDYQMGTKSDAELWAEIQQSIQQLDAADKLEPDANKHFFKNPAHKYIVEAALQMRFADPKFFGESFKPIAQGTELLEKCVKAGHENGVLSNWGNQSFPYLQAALHNVIFKYFHPNKIFASSQIKQAKPHREIYQHVIDATDMNPEDIIFIDDQIKNVEAARAVGINAIHVADYKNPQSYQDVEAELKALGAL